MRYAVLAHDRFDPANAKTAHALVRYGALGWSKNPVAAVVDRSKAGRDASEFVGELGRGVPVVATVEEAIAKGANALAIGIAPNGGQLPPEWKPDVEAALKGGLTVVSGMHGFLGDDPHFAKLAEEHGGEIWDVRRPPKTRAIATGDGAIVDALVVTTVGTECSSGKMTTSIELVTEARRRGIKAGFVATGQTGIMIGCDAGVPLDACISDFAAGLLENAVLEAASKGFELIVVEGQGALSHPAYSGVSLSLLHGSFPDLLVLCDEPARETINAFKHRPVKFAVNRLGMEMHLNEALLEHVTGGTVCAISLLTRGLTDRQLLEATRAAELETGWPAADVLRGGTPKLLDAVLAQATKLGYWRDGRFAKGSKLKRTGVRGRGE